MARAMKFARSGGFRRNGIHVLVRRTAAHAPALAVLDNGGAAGGVVGAPSRPVLFSAPPPPPPGAGARPSLPNLDRNIDPPCVFCRPHFILPSTLLPLVVIIA